MWLPASRSGQSRQQLHPPADLANLLAEREALQHENAGLQEACQAAESHSAALHAECGRLSSQVESLRGQLQHGRESPDLQRQLKEVTACSS